MLNKLFGSRKRKPPFGSLVPLNPVHHPRIPVEEKSSSALKIIHAGGTTECYYMAVPASRIMEKYPSLILARPEIFRRPWDSVVQPDEILVPGQKFLVVPLPTVKKLRRRIRKTPIKDNIASSFVSESSVSAELVSKQQDELTTTSKSFLIKGNVSKSIKSKAKNKVGNHHRVSFVGVDSSSSSRSKPDSNSVSMEKNNSKSRSGSGERKRRVRNALTWEPSLTVIAEVHGSDD